MAKWRLVASGPRLYDPDSTDCAVGWAWDVASDGEERTVKVELSNSAAKVVAGKGALSSPEADEARRTRGRSAVSAYLDEDDPPARLVVSTHGVKPDV